MAIITISDRDYNECNLFYVQNTTQEILNTTESKFSINKIGSRAVLQIDCDDVYKDIVFSEVLDKVADVIAINYKYSFFKKNVMVCGLSVVENEILMASLIAADLEEDKKYSFDKMKGSFDIAIDGIFNFRLKPLKKKWQDIVSYIPHSFVNYQLKEFIYYLLENKKKRIFIDDGRVYDSHYRRLKRSQLLGNNELNIIKEVILSNCGEIELFGEISKADEKCLMEYYGDRVVFSNGEYKNS